MVQKMAITSPIPVFCVLILQCKVADEVIPATYILTHSLSARQLVGTKQRGKCYQYFLKAPSLQNQKRCDSNVYLAAFV